MTEHVRTRSFFLKCHKVPALFLAGVIGMAFSGASYSQSQAGAGGAASYSLSNTVNRPGVNKLMDRGGAGTWALILLGTLLIFQRPAWKKLL